MKSFRITLEGREETSYSVNRRADVKTSPLEVIDVEPLARAGFILSPPGQALRPRG